MYSQTHYLRQPGPLLIAANHPNSFLDALIIGAQCKRRIYILVRGDVFHNKIIAKVLRALYCLPIYRLSEGRENLGKNEFVFQECLEIFKRGDNVLIFPEGNCENEWLLRPLHKGVARLAFKGWECREIGDRLKIIPVGISYEVFHHVGRKVFVQAGSCLIRRDLFTAQNDLKGWQALTHQLRDQLNKCILPVENTPEQVRYFQMLIQQAGLKETLTSEEHLGWIRQQLALARQTPPLPLVEKNLNSSLSRSGYHQILYLFFFPLWCLGWLLHAPLYYPLEAMARKKTGGTVFYDSVLFGLLFFLYPVYFIFLAIMLVMLSDIAWVVGILPLITYLTAKGIPLYAQRLSLKRKEEGPPRYL